MLNDVISYLHRKLQVYPLIGAELEFYIKNIENRALECLLSKLQPHIKSLSCSIDKEDHDFQYELRTHYSGNIERLLTDLLNAKDFMENTTKPFGGILDFTAKPFISAPGSAFHVHISLMDKEFSRNLFSKRNGIPNNLLLNCIGGLYYSIKEHMVFFAPNHSSYLRYIHANSSTPTTISWGGNNRSVALRLPDTTLAPEKCRIEHRVPGADCDYKLAIIAILLGIIRGIEDSTTPPKRIFGIASDPQYELEKLPLSLQEAQKFCKALSIPP